MAQLLGISIDLSKIDKSRIKAGNNGQKYYDITISVNDEEDKYGKDVQVWETQTKEERESKVNRNFLGNGKTLWSGSQGQKATTPAPAAPAAQVAQEDDGFPF